MGHTKRQPKDLVSIIVPKRRSENISALLECLRRQTYDEIEILVIDEGLERSYQRNIGIKRAKGKYLFILDSDQFPMPELIAECVEKMKTCDALYIPEKLMTKGWFNYVRDWERQFYTGTPIDCVRFVRSDGCKYFDVIQSGPEDADFDRRVKGIKGITKNYVCHYEKVGMVDFFKKKAYYARSMKRFEERNPGDKVLSFWWRCFGVFFENGKWKRVLRRPDLMLAVWTIIFVRGVIYLCQK